MEFNRAELVVNNAIKNRVTPGAAWAVAQTDRPYLAFGGTLSYDSDSPAVDHDTLWDLASLTKVAGTTVMAMMLYEEGSLKLDSKVRDIIPSFRCSETDVRNLLLHDAGLPASHPDPTSFLGPEELLREILVTESIAGPGERTVYSDIGFIVLGHLLGQLAGQPLDIFLRQRVWRAIDLESMTFLPAPFLATTCAPTERVEPWRKALRSRRCLPTSEWIQGEVHDPTAVVLGGIAGHAGLFSNLADLASLIRNLPQLVKSETLALFSQAPTRASSRALGWDTQSVGSSAGERLGPNSFGHTGFTGTSIWIDPDRDLTAILLTNRIHPTASNQAIREVRRAFHDAVVEDVCKL